MKESLFIQFIKACFPKLALYVKEKETPKARTYLHKSMLREVYSADQKWEGTSANTTYVAADIVEMDSPLPVKKRGSIATSNGKLPKIGMKKILFESGINTINIMKAHYNSIDESSQAGKDAKVAEKKRIINKLLDDGLACSVGIDETNEKNFLDALSNGCVAVEDADNSGKAVRFDYGYKAENLFHTATKDVIAKEDIDKIFEKADTDGNTIVKVMLAKSTFNAMKKEQWAKELVADDTGHIYTDSTHLKTPTVQALQTALKNEYDADFTLVDRSIIVEKNGKQKSVKPWNADNIIFLCNEEVGSLVWGTLAEATNPVEGVKYSTIDNYKLISKYSKNEPSLQEVTAGQALVVPVIEDVDQIYSLSLASEEVDTTAETADTNDTYTTYKGKKYTKTALIAALKAAGVKVNSNASDETLVKALNSLSDEEEAAVLATLTPQS